MKDDNADKISQNYIGMNDIGKQKLIQVAEYFSKIKNVVNRENMLFDDKNEIKEVENK